MSNPTLTSYTHVFHKWRQLRDFRTGRRLTKHSWSEYFFLILAQYTQVSSLRGGKGFRGTLGRFAFNQSNTPFVQLPVVECHTMFCFKNESYSLKIKFINRWFGFTVLTWGRWAGLGGQPQDGWRAQTRLVPHGFDFTQFLSSSQLYQVTVLLLLFYRGAKHLGDNLKDTHLTELALGSLTPGQPSFLMQTRIFCSRPCPVHSLSVSPRSVLFPGWWP